MLECDGTRSKLSISVPRRALMSGADSIRMWLEVTAADPGSTPNASVRLACGSRSISSTLLPASASAAPRESVVVVFATPPFSLDIAMAYVISELRFRAAALDQFPYRQTMSHRARRAQSSGPPGELPVYRLRQVHFAILRLLYGSF